MKVALIGAAGSGKTKYARRIATRLNKAAHQQYKKDHPEADKLTTPKSTVAPWKIIDGYADDLKKRTGRDISIEADYLTNLMIALRRRELEDEAYLNGYSTITCGTIYETVVYGGIYSLGISYIENEQARANETLVAQFCMGTMNVIEQRLFDYDALFYLPLEDEERTWDHAIDAKIPQVLEACFKTAVLLDGTDRQRVDRATRIINEVKAISEKLASANE